MKVGIPSRILKKVFRHAQWEYPRECCGLMLGTSGGPVTRLRICKNVQEEYCRDNPQHVKDTIRRAYQIDPRDLLAVQKEIRGTGEKICVIYHSHNDEPAEFSQEDARLALGAGGPFYPGTEYLIVSIIKGRVHDAKIYAWDPSREEFLS